MTKRYKTAGLFALLCAFFVPPSVLADTPPWDLSGVSIPISDLTDDTIRPVGGTRYGRPVENPSGTWLVYTEYTNVPPTHGGHAQSLSGASLQVVRVRQDISVGPPNYTPDVGFADRVYTDVATIDSDLAVNNHEGAGHIWVNDQVVAYQKRHMETFSIYDVENEVFIAEDIKGELGHATHGGVIYLVRDNRALEIRGLDDDCTMDGSYPLCYEREDQGVYSLDIVDYDADEDNVTMIVSKEEIIRFAQTRPSYNISNSTDVSFEGEVSSVIVSPDSDKVVVLYVSGRSGTGWGNETDWNTRYVLYRGEVPGDDIVVMSTDSLHPMWFDNETLIFAEPRTVVTNLSGSTIEYLTGDAVHSGSSPNKEWYVSDAGELDASDDDAEVFLYRRGQHTPVTKLAEWNSVATWSGVAHASPAFSGNGKRIYFTKGSGLSFNLNLIDFSAYRRTVHDYCAVGTPYSSARSMIDGTHPRLTQVVLSDSAGAHLSTTTLEHPDDYFLYGSIPGATLGALPVSLRGGPGNNYFVPNMPTHGYGVSPDYVWEDPPVIEPGDTKYLVLRGFGLGRDSIYRIDVAVDWNQNRSFENDEFEAGSTFLSEDTTAILGPSQRVQIDFPEDAIAGDTLIRVRVHSTQARTSNINMCGVADNTITYDFPIVIEAEEGCENCCTASNSVRDVYDSSDADSVARNAFEDNNNVWEAGVGEWTKVCFADTRSFDGMALDFKQGSGTQNIAYKFKVEGLNASNSSRWVTLIDNGRGLNGTGFSREEFYVSHYLSGGFDAIRYTGYGNDCARSRCSGNDNPGKTSKLSRVGFSPPMDSIRLIETTYVRYNSNDEDNIDAHDHDADQNYGHSEFMHVHHNKTESDGDMSENLSQSYLQFELPSGLSSISRATLRMKVVHASAEVWHDVVAVESNWDEYDVTYNDRPDEIDSDEESTFQVPDSGEWAEADVTDIMQHALNNGEHDLSLLVRNANAIRRDLAGINDEGRSKLPGSAGVEYLSKETSEASDRPHIVYVRGRQ